MGPLPPPVLGNYHVESLGCTSDSTKAVGRWLGCDPWGWWSVVGALWAMCEGGGDGQAGDYREFNPTSRARVAASGLWEAIWASTQHPLRRGATAHCA